MKHDMMFYRKLEDATVRCHLCSHHFRIAYTCTEPTIFFEYARAAENRWCNER